MKTIIYIDSSNLHKTAKDLSYKIDYKRLFRWLEQKYTPDKIIKFMGYIKSNEHLYSELRDIGFHINFRESVNLKGSIKGNCDSELILECLIHYYEENIDNFILITNDGDFSCLVNFLLERNKKVLLLSPNIKKCSILLKKTEVKITKLNDQYYKFSK